MQFDLRTLSASRRYKILGTCVIPRPIAWVTSQSGSGVRNVAPFSFFNVIGNDPPTVVLGIVARGNGGVKDTALNIRATGEFVINLVDEDSARAMNLTSAEVPGDVDEGELAGLSFESSVTVAPPRIATSPASFECRTTHVIETGPSQFAILAEVLFAHVADRFITDPERLTIDAFAMNLIARLHGAGWYGRQTDVFEMLRPKS